MNYPLKCQTKALCTQDSSRTFELV